MKKFIPITAIALTAALVSCATQTGQLGNRAKGARPSPQTMMQHKDTNKDGFLSYQEFQTRSNRSGQGSVSSRPQASEEMKQKRFATIDTNADQRLSLAELLAAPQRPSKKAR